MNKAVDCLFMSIGFLMFSACVLFWIAVLASPFVFAYWWYLKPLLSSWTPMHTFGALLALGLTSFIYLIATWGKGNNE